MTQEIQKMNEEIKAKLAAALQDPKLKEAVETITKASDEDAGTFEVVISTDDLDRHGEVIEAAGWLTDSYLKNPVVLWAHDYNELPIGICLELRAEGNKKIAKGRFAPGSANPKAQQVRQLYDAGIMRATSVGGVVHEMEGNRITKFEMVEFSFVPVPANPNALALAAEKKLELGAFITRGLVLDQKGAVADVANSEYNTWEVMDQKYAALRPVFDIVSALVTAYTYPTVSPDGLNPLLLEAVQLLEAIGKGMPASEATSDGMKAAMKDSRSMITEKTFKEAVKDIVEKEEKQDEGDMMASEKIGAIMQNTQNKIDAAFVDMSREVLGVLANEDDSEPEETPAEEGKSLVAKEGRVLSKKNRELIQNAISPMKESISALETLLAATSAEGGTEEKSADGGDSDKGRKAARPDIAEALKAHVLSKKVLRAVNTATSEALAEYNQRTRK